MISDIEEETQDIDWFAVDVQGEIGHFTTGGRGFLPPSVKTSKENQSNLNSFFRKLAKNGGAVESPNLPSQIRFESQAQKDRYLEDYFLMAGNGLYSFDCIVARQRPTSYFLVAIPSNPLSLEDLPKNIREVIQKTRFPGSFAKLDVIQRNDFLSDHVTKLTVEHKGRFERT